MHSILLYKERKMKTDRRKTDLKNKKNEQSCYYVIYGKVYVHFPTFLLSAFSETDE